MAFITDLGFTLLELGKAKDDGDVRSQVHPEFPNLEIFNYTEEVQYRNKWNKITLACRGLILDTVTGEVVARPWEKFFNFGQMDNRIDSMAPVEVTDKIDGSLGILYTTEPSTSSKAPRFSIATRGSFASEQAIHATKVWQDKYEAEHTFNAHMALDYTFLFEIVYPENRIVVNYGDTDDLILLGAVNKEYGYYYGPLEAAGLLGWTGPVTEVFKANHFVDALSLPDRAGKEGYVIRSGRNIVKMKQADYVELHRIVTNLSPKTIWEMLVHGETVESICEPLPDEFYSYVETIAAELCGKFSDIKFQSFIEFANIKAKLWKGEGTTISRRAWAEEIKKSTYPSLLFMRLDDKPIDEAVWKLVKPRGDVKPLVDDNA